MYVQVAAVFQRGVYGSPALAELGTPAPIRSDVEGLHGARAEGSGSRCAALCPPTAVASVLYSCKHAP